MRYFMKRIDKVTKMNKPHVFDIHRYTRNASSAGMFYDNVNGLSHLIVFMKKNVNYIQCMTK